MLRRHRHPSIAATPRPTEKRPPVNTFLWIGASLLAAALLAAGSMKLTKPRPALAASGLASAEAFSGDAVKGIGALEVLAALGLILPALLDIAPYLVPLAAAGVVLLMGGAAITPVRRKEYPLVAVNVVIGGLALVIAVLRFGSQGF